MQEAIQLNNMDLQTKFKDRDPIETVNKLKDIFTSLNISVVEDWIDSGVNSCYSLRVQIEKTTLGQNGKGATSDFARASGYGELYERIANDLMYIGDYAPDAGKKSGFYYAPDEEYLTASDIVKNNPSYLNILTDKIIKSKEADRRNFAFLNPKESNDKNQLILEAVDEWAFLKPQGYDGKQDFIGLPFYNITKEKTEVIPYSMLRSTYGTNGTCTGNTIDEALVQGLSEIYERYVNFYLITHKITPPDIPEEYLKTFPDLWKMIEDIHNKGAYKVIIKDCSLGIDYPVVAVILINRNTQTYRVNLAPIHPSQLLLNVL
ncbi:MAG: YcaO-like family protein [Spirochaetaceae bacterium]|nr:YcaO-like family protein [Spirochaetaceae bacterium]